MPTQDLNDEDKRALRLIGGGVMPKPFSNTDAMKTTPATNGSQR